MFIGITVPRTGTYAVQGEDELKGYMLAVEHINGGNPLIKMISPKTTKGVLGKEVKYGVADAEAKPNTAVQEQSRFLGEDSEILMTGATSSAVAVALNKLAQREKVLYVVGISGSNDTTGKDCARYSFRQCLYGQTTAAAIGPVLLKTYGKNKKAAYLTPPDYTSGHTVQKSMEDYLAKNGGWTTATNQVAPLGAPDYSSYLLNVANSGADYLLNINWGREAVLWIQQAQQFGIFNKMKLVIPYQVPFLSQRSGSQGHGGRLRRDRFLVDIEDEYPVAKMFVEAFDEVRLQAGVGADNAYMQFAMWADACERAGAFSPPEVIKAYEAGQHIHSTVGDVYFRAADHQLVRPVIIVRGKAPSAMKDKEDFWEVDGDRARRQADAGAGRVRLPPRRLYLSNAALRWPGGYGRLHAAPIPVRQPSGPSAPHDHLAQSFSQLFNGLASGALLALIASGLTIIYGTLGVLNLAHGAMFMLGGYAGWVAFQATGSFAVAVIAGSLFLVVVGGVMELVIIRRFYSRPPEDQILVTFGIGIVIVELVRLGFGSLTHTVPPPAWASGVTPMGFLIYPTYRIVVLGIWWSPSPRFTSSSIAPVLG